MADHGHPLADHGMFLKGGDRIYNELLRVPFMIRLPGGRGARRTPALVQFHDVLPTQLELAGLENDTSALHGQSFAGVLRGEKDTHREAIITGYHEAVDRCVRDLQWSYVQRPAGDPDELYRLDEDPKEQRNLIDAHPDEAVRLARAFGSYFRRSGAQAVVKGIQGRYELSSSGIE
jgi:arylsulfatase A-like enzyme